LAATMSINRRRVKNEYDNHRHVENDRAIGIDIGVSTISAGVVDLRTGAVVARCHEATPSGDVEVLRRCAVIAGELASRHHIGCVGLAVPERVDRDSLGQHPVTRSWRSSDVRLAFAEIAPTLVHSDVRAAAYCEAQAGAARGLECFVYVTVSTEVSSVVVRHGRPSEDLPGDAPVVRVPPVGLDSRRPAAVAHDRPELIVEARRLGEEVGRVVNLIEPDAVVVGGALGLDPRYRQVWVNVMRQSQRYRPASCVPVIEAQFKADAVLVGAALASGALVPA
jgi:predicted NBD/HSP70 family sugar kinase